MSQESPNQEITGRDVFVSYTSADARVADQVCQALEAQGVL